MNPVEEKPEILSSAVPDAVVALVPPPAIPNVPKVIGVPPPPPEMSGCPEVPAPVGKLKL